MLTRRKPPKSGIKRVENRLYPQHRAWVRGFVCLAHESGECSGKIEAAHVRSGTDGGTGIKPHDKWTVPLCAHHHREQHSIGESSFERKYGVDMKKAAERLARTSPHKWRWED